MSKIGRQPIKIAQGVTVEVSGQTVKTTGPKGVLTRHLPHVVNAEVKDGEVLITVKGSSKQASSLHGTFRSIINNDVFGVSTGWSKKLELVGTGFRAEVSGKTLSLTVGYSHPVVIQPTLGIQIETKENKIIVSGADKVMVGEIAAKIRRVRPPEPYKGKGIKYQGEFIRRKAGKAVKAAGGGS